MNKKELDGVMDLSFEEKVVVLQNVRTKMEELKNAEWLVARSIIEDMEDEGSSMTRRGDYLINIKRDVRSYDPNILAELREITDPRDLQGIYAPEHEEVKTVTVREKWNMKAGMKLKKMSLVHADIINKAKIYKYQNHDPRRVKITPGEGVDFE